jgi:hypothetical protein
MTATDPAKAFATQTVSVKLTAVNDAPFVARAVATPVNLTEGDAPGYTLPAGTFKDVDDTTLSHGAAGLPTGIPVDPKTGKLAGRSRVQTPPIPLH